MPALLHLLRRHPFPILAHFRHSFVLTYAYPAEELQKLLPPGLEIDTGEGCGFLAVACVETQGLRPSLAPGWLGQDFYFIGYRLFVRHRTADGRRLRGLYILRSEVDRRGMETVGNFFSHYRWHHAHFKIEETFESYRLAVTSKDGRGDLDVEFDLTDSAPPLPVDSCFGSWHRARLFAGPMPFTFDYEPETNSIVRVEGVREDWTPRPITATVRTVSFLQQEPWVSLGAPRLVSAFAVHDIPYRWNAGILERLP